MGNAATSMKSETYNTDCLEAMRQMPDKAFDLAIVDPPYAVGAADCSFGGQVGKLSNVVGNSHAYANADTPPDAEYFAELFRVSHHQIIWGANYYPQHLTHSGAIVWDKMTTGVLSDCELAFQSFNKLVRKVTIGWGGYFKQDARIFNIRIHPNQKPVALYKWLLQNYAKPGDTILDTHLGSGSSRIAAYDLGFDFTGYELDADYFNAQEKRFKEHCDQPKLWTPAPAALKQGVMFATT